MEGRENASIIDLKMGTSTVTCNIVANPHRFQKRLNKDKQTTSAKLGLKVIGYVIKSSSKKVDERFYKFPYISAERIPDVLRRIFAYPKGDSSYKVMQSHFPDSNSESKQEMRLTEPRKSHVVSSEHT